MRTTISRKNVMGPFVAKVQELSGQNLLACYQCGKCSAGCPVVEQMDILPNQIIRLAQLGLQEDLLESRAIWVCASCMTCNVRCPKGINIAEVIEVLRTAQKALFQFLCRIGQIRQKFIGRHGNIRLANCEQSFQL